jgi:transglycosylase-like protein with SLT domain
MNRAAAIEELKRRGVNVSDFDNKADNNFLYENVARPFARAGKSLAKGALSLTDLPYIPINAAATSLGYQPFTPGSELVGDLIDQYAGDFTTARNDTERRTNRTTDFISSLASGGPAAELAKMGGQTNKISNFLQETAPKKLSDLIPAGASGYASEMAAQNNPNNILAPLIGGVGGALLGGGAVSAANAIRNPKTTLQESLASGLKIDPNKVQSFQDAELNPTLADVSNVRAVGTTQNVLKEAPFVGTPIENSINKTQQDIAKFLKEEKLYSPLTQSEAGDLAQSGLRRSQEKGFAETSKRAQKLSTHIEDQTLIPVNNLLDSINKLPNLSTPEATSLFQKSQYGGIVKKLKDAAVRNDGKIPYADFLQFQDEIANNVTTFGMVGKKEQGALKNLYGKAKQDLGEYFSNVSPEAKKDFDEYNKFYSTFAKRNEKVVNKLLNNRTATETFKDIINNQRVDGRKAREVLNTLNPEEKELFSGSLIREIGSTNQNEFSTSTLSTKFKSLEPEVQDIILSPYSKETQNKFRSIVDAIDNIKSTRDTGNSSRSAYSWNAGATATGLITAPFATLSILAAGRTASSQLFTNPKFINWLADAQSIKNPQQAATHINRLNSIAKSTPSIASGINKYLSTMKEIEQETPQETQQAKQENPESNTEDLRKRAQAELAKRNINWESGSELKDQEKKEDSLLKKIATVESNNNPNARSRTSSASGLYQFTNGTWKNMVNKYGKEYGIALKDKNNPEAQKIMAEKLLEDNRQSLKNSINRNPTNGELYLAHFMGAGGAAKLIKSNPNAIAARVFPEEARANKTIFFKNSRPRTIKEVYKEVTNKV